MADLLEDSATPAIIRAACRARFYDALDIFSDIASDPDARDADRIKAVHELGVFGLGTADQGAVHIHAGEGSQVIGVIHLPVLDQVPTVEDEEPAKEDEPKLLAPPEDGPSL